ncbi:MAG TPA: phosphodiester glycosidase family protein [Prosthecobacter sp.]
MFALVGCVQPPLPEPPAPIIGVAPVAQQPALAPAYPSWDEVQTRQPMPLAEGDATPVPVNDNHGGLPLVGGASLHKTTVSTAGGSIDFEVVLFDSRQHTLKVIDQPQDFVGGGQITASMRQAGAIAGVNGGFFTPQFAPMGLMTADGRSTGAWQANKLLTGAVVGGAKPQLLWNAEARSRQSAAQFLQAGPRLVDAGKAVPSLERRKHTTRTFIATDGGQRWLIGLARGTSLGELADALASSEIVPGFRIQRALNLDGGRSSALYYRTVEGQEHSDPGWSTVRNYLGIVPR